MPIGKEKKIFTDSIHVEGWVMFHCLEIQGCQEIRTSLGNEKATIDEVMAAAKIANAHQFIEKLEKAMMRIQNKTYGICRVTGKLIDRARLRAVPHATLSMEAKTNMNKPGNSSHQ